MRFATLTFVALIGCFSEVTDDVPEVADEDQEAVGCGIANQPVGVRSETIVVAGVERRYLLSVPEGYDPARRYPLVFGWHGLASSPEVSRAYFGIEQAAAGQLIMVYPQGLGVPAGWNLDPAGPDFQFFDALIAHIASRYCIEPRHVFATGHSFGAYMTNALGCYRPGVFAAIAPVAGGGPFATCPAPTPAVVVHGTQDMIVPFILGQWTRDDWLRTNGCGIGSPIGPFDPPCVVAYCSKAPVVWCAHSDPGFFGHGWPAFVAPVVWKVFSAVP